MIILEITLVLKILFAAMAAMFSFTLAEDLKKHSFKKEKANPAISAMIGGISYFFNTLGIGSFATSTAMLRSFKQIEDKKLPGTLNVTSVLPELVAAFIFISIIKVDPLTISCMVAATCVGSWTGAWIVHKMSEQKICMSMAIALFLAASVLLLKQFDLLPTSYTGSLGFTGMKLVFAMLGSAGIGVLGAMGIGSYAPFLALTLTLGLGARAAFPIMMSSTALGNGFASMKFIKHGNYARKSTLWMIIAAIFGVVIAAYIVKTLPLYILTWVVIGIIFYTSISLFMKSISKK